MSSYAEKKILKGDVRALNHVSGKNASGKEVNFSLSQQYLEQETTGLKCSKGELGQNGFFLFLLAKHQNRFLGEDLQH